MVEKKLSIDLIFLFINKETKFIIGFLNFYHINLS